MLVTETAPNPIAVSPIVEGDGSSNPGATGGPVVLTDSAEPVLAPELAENTPAEPIPVPPSGQIPDWYQKRFNELVGKRNEAERIAEMEKDARLAAETRATQLLEQISKGITPTSAQPVLAQIPMSETEIDRRASEKAATIFAEQRAREQAAKFNEVCNTVSDTGKKEFKDWDNAVTNLKAAGAIGDPKQVSPEFLETVVELKNPAQILHHLGMNPEEAARIASMPPKRMALELARVESALLNKPVEKLPISLAPTPVIPINGKGSAPTGSLDDPNTPAEDWFALRSKQIEEKRNRYRKA